MREHVNSKMVGRFLKEISEQDYGYLRLTMQIRDGIQDLIAGGVERKDIIKRFKIPARRYQNFIKGNVNYSLHEIATLQAMRMEQVQEKMLKEDSLTFKQTWTHKGKKP